MPDGTKAALPTNARLPIVVGRKATCPLQYVALPTLAMSATKDSSPIVSRSGSMFAIVETSERAPILAPSLRSHHGVYTVEYRVLVCSRLSDSSLSANHFSTPRRLRRWWMPTGVLGRPNRRSARMTRHEVVTKTGPVRQVMMNAGHSPKAIMTHQTSTTTGSSAMSGANSRATRPHANRRLSAGDHSRGACEQSAMISRIGSSTVSRRSAGDPCQTLPAGRCWPCCTADWSRSTDPSPRWHGPAMTQLAPTVTERPRWTRPTTRRPSLISVPSRCVA